MKPTRRSFLAGLLALPAALAELERLVEETRTEPAFLVPAEPVQFSQFIYDQTALDAFNEAGIRLQKALERA